jgi:hypothetical protein
MRTEVCLIETKDWDEAGLPEGIKTSNSKAIILKMYIL